jgi:hypothetical protein
MVALTGQPGSWFPGAVTPATSYPIPFDPNTDARLATRGGDAGGWADDSEASGDPIRAVERAAIRVDGLVSRE